MECLLNLATSISHSLSGMILKIVGLILGPPLLLMQQAPGAFNIRVAHDFIGGPLLGGQP